MSRYPELCVENCYLFRITHEDNLPAILASGIPSQNTAPSGSFYRNIGNLDLIGKRRTRAAPIPPGGLLSDYVPFYFTPRSMMLYNILTGTNVERQNANEIVIMVSSLRHLVARGTRFVFTDGHANMQESTFYNDPARVDRIDWTIIGNSDFGRSGSDPGKSNRYQAEFLVHRHVAFEDLLALACFDADAKSRYQTMAARAGRDIKVAMKHTWYPR